MTNATISTFAQAEGTNAPCTFLSSSRRKPGSIWILSDRLEAQSNVKVDPGFRRDDGRWNARGRLIRMALGGGLAVLFAMMMVTTPAHAGEAAFATSFEPGEPRPDAESRAGTVQLAIGSGPEAPYAAKKNAGYGGLHALRYRAERTGGRAQLFAVDIPVQADTTLSWLVLPEIVEGDVAVSTGVSLDLLFDDGQRLSELEAHDQHGVRVGAAAQAASKTLYPQQWARKSVRMGDVAALRERRIRAIELELAPVGAQPASGWIDDIAIVAADSCAFSPPAGSALGFKPSIFIVP